MSAHERLGFPFLLPFPQRDTDCWIGPRFVWGRGQQRTTVRELLHELLPEGMHNSWRPKRACPTQGCTNPHHYNLEMMWRTTGEPPEPTPYIEVPPLAHDEEIEDLASAIYGLDTRDPHAINEHMQGLYTLDQIEQALEGIRNGQY